MNPLMQITVSCPIGIYNRIYIYNVYDYISIEKDCVQ